MPRTLWCCGLAASGDWLPSPSVEAVIEYMRAAYDEWGWADPMVELAVYDRRGESVPPAPGMSGDELVRQLLIIRHVDRGFYFEYSERLGRWLAAIDPAGGRAEWGPNMSHGDVAYFLATCLIPPAASERVVIDFVATQEPSAAVEWVPFESLSPRRNQPPRRRRG